ncbi:septal ring lytic transglycosylase RlpA family protein [Thermomonas brevis]
MTLRGLLLAALPLALAACATTGGGAKQSAGSSGHAPSAPTASSSAAHPPKKASPYAPAQEDLSKRGDYVAGGLFRPGVADTVPDEIPDVDAIPEPEVRNEPRARTGNRDYAVLGKKYRVLDDHNGYVEEGLASYYGKKFHGRRTSSQEVYDMYAFTAAHKTLPLPSFARVTNLDNGRSVVVRVNDRGPFHKGRIIDLSYAAAVKLGYRDRGTARVRVEALSADGDAPLLASAGDAASGMDRLVDKLPGAEQAAAIAGHRFDMRQDGRTMGASEFDAWMRSRRIRVATGKPAPVLVAATQVPAAAVASAPSAPGPSAAPATPASTVEANGDQVILQVASFGNQRNAERALSMLQGAAITRAQLQDADVNGKKVWRLRIGPVSESATPELAARIVGLGFGQPQRVRD